MSALLEARGLAVGYVLAGHEERRVLADVDLALGVGELVCVLGPNGSGKSTLLRTLARMQRPLAGLVLLEGENIGRLPSRDLARRVSVVLTEPLDVAGLTSWDLVALGRYPYTGWSGRLELGDRQQVERAIAAVGAESLSDREVTSLSDGERQRVLIARALAQEPQLMVLDEPTSHLDLPRRVETLGLLRELVRSTGVTALLATHHLDLALAHADRVWLLPEDGVLVSGAPEDVVLDGSLEETFRSEGLVFDPGEGTFRPRPSDPGAPIALEGQGLARRWTEKALHRRGYSVAASTATAPVRVRVVVGENGPRWELVCDQASEECTSIHELLTRLQERSPSRE